MIIHIIPFWSGLPLITYLLVWRSLSVCLSVWLVVMVCDGCGCDGHGDANRG